MGRYSALRALRLLRSLKLLKSWLSLRLLVSSVHKSFEDLVYFFGICILFVFIFSVLGMELFAGKLPPSDLTRMNFDSFGWSSLTVFQLVTGESWNTFLFLDLGGLFVGFILCTLVFGNFVLLSIFTAILLSRLDNEGGAPVPPPVSRFTDFVLINDETKAGQFVEKKPLCCCSFNLENPNARDKYVKIHRNDPTYPSSPQLLRSKTLKTHGNVHVAISSESATLILPGPWAAVFP